MQTGILLIFILLRIVNIIIIPKMNPLYVTDQNNIKLLLSQPEAYSRIPLCEWINHGLKSGCKVYIWMSLCRVQINCLTNSQWTLCDWKVPWCYGFCISNILLPLEGSLYISSYSWFTKVNNSCRNKINR